MPEHLEGPVVHRDVLGPAHEGGAARPVHVVATVEVEHAERVDEGEDRAEGHLEAGTAQHTGERDRDPLRGSRLRVRWADGHVRAPA